jgi:hypothetical protein
MQRTTRINLLIRLIQTNLIFAKKKNVSYFFVFLFPNGGERLLLAAPNVPRRGVQWDAVEKRGHGQGNLEVARVA